MPHDRSDDERPQACVDLGHPELSRVGGNDQIARAHQAESAGERVPVDARDDRLAKSRHVLEEVDERSAEAMLLDLRLLCGEATEVAARAEGLVPLPRENDDADRVVSARFAEGGTQFGHDGDVQGVALLGAVDRDARDRRGRVVANRSWFHHPLLPEKAG